jgi:hypothetical protein
MDLIRPGARLPPLQIETADGRVESLEAPERGSPALLFVRTEAREVARGYLESWERALPDLVSWYGRPLLVTDSVPSDTDIPWVIARDQDWRKLGIEPRANALIIADRWGIVYFAQTTMTFRDLPSSSEVELWLRYLATQCPECGVIDEPGYGEWAP